MYGPSRATDATHYAAYTDAKQDALLQLSLTNGLVTRLTHSAVAATRDDAQAVAACTPFLPVGTTQLYVVGPAIFYLTPMHSEVMLRHAPGSCLLSFVSPP